MVLPKSRVRAFEFLCSIADYNDAGKKPNKADIIGRDISDSTKAARLRMIGLLITLKLVEDDRIPGSGAYALVVTELGRQEIKEWREHGYAGR